MYIARYRDAAMHGNIALGHVPHLFGFHTPVKAICQCGQGHVSFRGSLPVQIPGLFQLHPDAATRGCSTGVCAGLIYNARVFQRTCIVQRTHNAHRALVCKRDACGNNQRSACRHAQYVVCRVCKVPVKLHVAVHTALAALIHHALPRAVCFTGLVANGSGPHHGACAGNRKAAAGAGIAGANARAVLTARGSHLAARDHHTATRAIVSAANARTGADASHSARGIHHAARNLYAAAGAIGSAANARAAIDVVATRGCHFAARDRHFAACAKLSAANARAGISTVAGRSAAGGIYHAAGNFYGSARLGGFAARAAANARAALSARGSHFAAMDGDASRGAAGAGIPGIFSQGRVIPADARAVAFFPGRGRKAAHFAFLCALRIHGEAVAFAHFNAAVHGEGCAVCQNQVHIACHLHTVFNGNRAICHIPCLTARRAPYGVALLHRGRVFLRVHLAVFAQILRAVCKRRRHPHQRRKCHKRCAHRLFAPYRSHTPHASFSAGPCSKHPSSALAQEGTRGFFCGVPAAQRTAGVMMLFLLYHNAAAFFYCPFWGAKRAYAARPFCPARRAKRKKRRIIIVFLHFRIVRIFSRTRTVVFAVCFVRA